RQPIFENEDTRIKPSEADSSVDGLLNDLFAVGTLPSFGIDSNISLRSSGENLSAFPVRSKKRD
ncbi:MAG: hypothetical protein ACKPKO_12885, partial [Candidatus Fonsibacter sp.]